MGQLRTNIHTHRIKGEMERNRKDKTINERRKTRLHKQKVAK
jgi:hypothetical protein